MAFFTPRTFFDLFLRSFICFLDLLTDSARPFCTRAGQACRPGTQAVPACAQPRTLMSLYLGSNFLEAVRLS